MILVGGGIYKKGEKTVKNIKQIALSILTGIIAGFIFAKLSLPIPAPISIVGFMGVFGVWLGAAVVDKVLGKLSKKER